MWSPPFPRASYVSPESYQQERERVFFRQWICVGRVEEVPDVGGHLVCDIAGENVLVTRTRDGAGLDWENGIEHRQGAWTFTATGTTNRRPFPGLSPEEKERHKGPAHLSKPHAEPFGR